MSFGKGSGAKGGGADAASPKGGDTVTGAALSALAQAFAQAQDQASPGVPSVADIIARQTLPQPPAAQSPVPVPPQAVPQPAASAIPAFLRNMVVDPSKMSTPLPQIAAPSAPPILPMQLSNILTPLTLGGFKLQSFR